MSIFYLISCLPNDAPAAARLPHEWIQVPCRTLQGIRDLKRFPLPCLAIFNYPWPMRIVFCPTKCPWLARTPHVRPDEQHTDQDEDRQRAQVHHHRPPGQHFALARGVWLVIVESALDVPEKCARGAGDACERAAQGLAFSDSGGQTTIGRTFPDY